MEENSSEQKLKDESTSESNSNKFSLKAINEKLKLFAPSLIVLTTIITAMGVIYAAFGYMDNAVEKKFRDPLFVEELALKTMTPFFIFDENEHVLYASQPIFYDEYINNFKVVKNDKSSIQEIILSFKKFLNLPPIIECLDANIEFKNAERINQIDWIYRAKKLKHPNLQITQKEGELSVKRFKITVIR